MLIIVRTQRIVENFTQSFSRSSKYSRDKTPSFPVSGEWSTHPTKTKLDDHIRLKTTSFHPLLYLEITGDALQGDGASVGDDFLLCVQIVRECEAQRNGGEEHLNADDEVLVSGGHGTGRLLHVSLLREERADHPGVLKYGQ